MKRRLNNATALSGNGKVRSPARLLVPFRRSPSPRTRISVLMILTEPILRVGSDRYSRRWREQGNAPLQAEVEERGLSWRQEVLELATVPAPAWIAEWFAIETEEPVFLRRRRTWIEGVATQLADSYYLLADVEETRIRQEETGPGAVWLGSKRRDSTWNGSVRNLWPVCPPPMKPADCNWDLACRSSNCTGSRSPARGRSRCSAPSWSAPATSLPTTSRPASNSMQITFDSQPSPGQRTNEDLAMAGPRFAFVLDGTTAPPDVESGCVHHVTWLVSRLAGELARLRVRDESPMLPNTLAGAISQVRAQHANTCDLKNPASPSSTVALIRETRETIDYLLLADSPIVIRTLDGSVHPVHDNRTEYLPGYTPDIVREHRNVHGGIWVASTKPEAAYDRQLPNGHDHHGRNLQRRHLAAGRTTRLELGPTSRTTRNQRPLPGHSAGPRSRRDSRGGHLPRQAPRRRHRSTLSLPIHESRGLSEEGCKWLDTPARGLAGKGR